MIIWVISKSRSRHSTWKKGCDSLTVVGLHENWTQALRCQVSAQPPAKKTAGQIEKETEVSYDLYEIKLRAQGVCMRINLILLVLVLVLVLVLEIIILF